MRALETGEMAVNGCFPSGKTEGAVPSADATAAATNGSLARQQAVIMDGVSKCELD